MKNVVLYTIINLKRYYYLRENNLILNRNDIIFGCLEIDNYKGQQFSLCYFNCSNNDNLYDYQSACAIVKQKEILKEVELFLNRFNNPFVLSLDNKRYYSFDCFSKRKYGKKIVKIPLDGPFSCPNRDGSISNTGCVFCYGGSNAFPDISQKDLSQQYPLRKAIYDKKWQNYLPYCYFQSYSNTYGSLNKLKTIYEPFIDNSEVEGLVISTRSDCLNQEKIDYLNSLCQYKPIWIELGLQSTYNDTLKQMNRGHDFESFLNCIEMLSNTNLFISVHLINGWPSENIEMMLNNAKIVGKLPIQAVKFHMLHVCKNTPLGKYYQNNPFKLLDKQSYCQLVSQQLCYLKSEIVIERLTGDSLKEVLLAPDWTIKKVSVLNDIDKEMLKNNYFQGKYF